MKKLSKILAILCVCFLANMAVADDMSLKELEQIKKEQDKYWLEFLAGTLYDDSAENIAKLAFVKKHFVPLWYEIITNDKGQKVADTICGRGDEVGYCQYLLKKSPFKFKGILTINARYDSISDCSFATPYSAVFDSKEVPNDFFLQFNVYATKNNQKEILKNMPKWLLDGFAGEVKYEVEIEIKNTNKIALSIYGDACSDESYMFVDNITFIKKISEKKYKNLEQYLKTEEEYEELLVKIHLKTNDDFVNLRDSPNGKVITRIYKKDFSDILIIKTFETELLGLKPNETKDWYKVIYFPPNTRKTEDAKAGFIHKSQIDEDRLYELR